MSVFDIIAKRRELDSQVKELMLTAARQVAGFFECDIISFDRVPESTQLPKGIQFFSFTVLDAKTQTSLLFTGQVREKDMEVTVAGIRWVEGDHDAMNALYYKVRCVLEDRCASLARQATPLVEVG